MSCPLTWHHARPHLHVSRPRLDARMLPVVRPSRRRMPSGGSSSRILSVAINWIICVIDLDDRAEVRRLWEAASTRRYLFRLDRYHVADLLGDEPQKPGALSLGRQPMARLILVLVPGCRGS